MVDTAPTTHRSSRLSNRIWLGIYAASAIASFTLFYKIGMAGADTTTTLDPPSAIQAAGDSVAPGFAAMCGILILLPIIGIAIRRTFNAIRNAGA